MKCEAVVFDMDGTILNTLEDLKNSVNSALVQCGFPVRTLREIRSFVGNGIRLLVERSVPEGTPKDEIDCCFEAFRTDYALHSMDLTAPYDGIPEVLRTLKEAGIKTAVVSNKADAAVQPLCNRFFPGLFDVAIGERAGLEKKPAPDAVFQSIRELGVRAEKCIFVGDSEVDVATAKNAGLPCIACLWGFRDREVIEPLSPEYLIDTPAQILGIVLEKKGKL